MLMLLMLLAAVCGIASFVYYIILVVKAFNEGAGWGLAVLFLPFASLIYAIKFWHDAKKPFLLHVGTSIASAVLFVGGSVMAVGQAANQMMNDPEFAAAMQEMQQQMEAGAQEEGGFDFESSSGTDDGFASGANDTISGAADSTAAQPQGLPSLAEVGSTPALPRLALPSSGDAAAAMPSSRPKAVVLNQARRYVGQRVRITNHRGGETIGTLVGTKGDRLMLERDLGGGVASFSVRRSEIQALHVLPSR